MDSIKNTDNATSVVRKANSNFNTLNGGGATLAALTINSSSSEFITDVNSNFDVLNTESLNLQSIDEEDNAFTVVEKLNTNFTALSHGDVPSEGTAVVYDLNYVSGNTATKFYAVDVSKNKLYTFRKSSQYPTPSPLYKYYRIGIYDSEQKLIEYWYSVDNYGNVVTKESKYIEGELISWDMPFYPKDDASYIGIRSYSGNGQKCCTIEHEEPLPSDLIKDNFWFQKKWLLVGDSITTEEDGYATVGYGKLIANYFGLREFNCAVSGTTTVNWVNASNVTDISSVSSDYGLITVMLGTNDEGYNLSATSYANRSLQIYLTLKERCPNAVIVFITPIKRWKNGALVSLSTYINKLKEMCSDNNIPCIDVYNDDEDYTAIDPSTLEARQEYFVSADGSDGTHPNDLGHAVFLYPRIKAWLEDNTFDDSV